MVCQKCQAAEATVHTTTIVNGNSTESHLCAKCGQAVGLGLSGMMDPLGLIQQVLAPFPGLFPGLAQHPNMAIQPPSKVASDQKCPHCGITLGDIQVTGKLGCPHDYTVFGDALSRVILVAQSGNTQHVGKVPKGVPVETHRTVLQAKIDNLQRRLDGAVFREDYEQAAKHRDDIQDARSELDQAG